MDTNENNKGNQRKDMENIFNSLTEGNKEIVILLARSVKVAQDITITECRSIEV